MNYDTYSKLYKNLKFGIYFILKYSYNNTVYSFSLVGKMTETWKPIPNFQGFEASDSGRIRRSEYVTVYADGSRKLHEAKILDNHINSGVVVTNFLGSTYHTHRLVASAFYGDIDKLHIRFIDGDKLNIKLSNLRCYTPSESVKLDIQSGVRKNPPVYRGVEVICNETGIVYRSIKNLSETLNLPRSSVRRYIHQQKSIDGYTYSFYHGGGDSDAKL